LEERAKSLKGFVKSLAKCTDAAEKKGKRKDGSE